MGMSLLVRSPSTTTLLISSCLVVLVLLSQTCQSSHVSSPHSPPQVMGNSNMHLHLVYVSKRRVPNGADPIHNRRAGKAGKPQGRA